MEAGTNPVWSHSQIHALCQHSIHRSLSSYLINASQVFIWYTSMLFSALTFPLAKEAGKKWQSDCAAFEVSQECPMLLHVRNKVEKPVEVYKYKKQGHAGGQV